jgi:hypothetical protein
VISVTGAGAGRDVDVAGVRLLGGSFERFLLDLRVDDDGEVADGQRVVESADRIEKGNAAALLDHAAVNSFGTSR